MTDKCLERVREFTKAFNRPLPTKPNVDDHDLNALRIRLLREEIDELEDALQFGNIPHIMKEITDIQYILDGTYIELGLSSMKDAASAKVHASNMSKLGEDGKPIYRKDGKVLKGPAYFEPFMETIEIYCDKESE